MRDLAPSTTSPAVPDGTADGSRGRRPGPGKRRTHLPLVPALAILGGALAVAVIASLIIGTESIAPGRVFAALAGDRSDAEAHTLVFAYRLPRTIVAIVVGSALGVAGALMQAYTRNPLADPGILGINAGASFGVVIAVWAGATASVTSLMVPSLVGALLATVAVLLLAASGRGPATPLRMTLAGVALAAVLGGLETAIRLSDSGTFERFRSWAAGSVAGRSIEDVVAAGGYIAVGLVLALLLVRSLNAISLGEDLAASLGVHTRRVRLLTIVAVTLLAGAATAVAGPIGFLGLMVPHACRLLVGNDHTRIIPMSALAAPVLILAADIVARVLIPLREMPVGVVTAFLGGPVLIWLLRGKKVSTL